MAWIKCLDNGISKLLRLLLLLGSRRMMHISVSIFNMDTSRFMIVVLYVHVVLLKNNVLSLINKTNQMLYMYLCWPYRSTMTNPRVFWLGSNFVNSKVAHKLQHIYYALNLLHFSRWVRFFLKPSLLTIIKRSNIQKVGPICY